MADTNINSAVTTNMTDSVPNFSVNPMVLDNAQNINETRWSNARFSQQLGYYKQIPELKSAVDTIAEWTTGAGYDTDPATEVLLENINGYGEDTFETILNNLDVISDVGGDAFAEVIRNDNGRIVNLKPLDPSKIVIVADKKGRIDRYEQSGKEKSVEFKPYEIFHLVKNRVADEIHGTSKIDVVENIILQRNEAIEDYKVVLHRNVVPVRILEVDTDDVAKIARIRATYEEAIKKKEVLIIPKGNVTLVTDAVSSNATLNPMPWIEYNSNFFFQAIGISQVILGGSQEFTEATAKIAYLSFEQRVKSRQRKIEAQLWQQLAVKIKLKMPASLQNELLSDNSKDTGQMGVQKNETTAGSGA